MSEGAARLIHSKEREEFVQGRQGKSCWEIWGSSQADWAFFTLWKPDMAEQGSELMTTEFRKTNLLAIME